MQNNTFSFMWLAAHAKRDPKALAIEQGLIQLSYGELLEAVDRRISSLPSNMGVGEIVAVEARRDINYVVEFLALSARKAVVAPIDMLLPTGRRNTLLSELCPHWLSGEDGSFLKGTSVRSGFVEQRIDLTPAYVFFTSGSTGRPKPVLGAAESLNAFLEWQRSTFEIGRDDRIPFLTALGFDVSLRDLLLPIAAGATLVIPEPADTVTPQALVMWLDAKRVTRLHAVPSVAGTWITAAPAKMNIPLKTVFFAGEPLTGGLVSRWRAQFPATQGVANFYGPTETTLASFVRVVTKKDENTSLIPVGKARPCTDVRLLPPGSEFTAEVLLAPSASIAEGEIVILTAYPSLGYIDRPRETTERFLELPGGLMAYRTGDLGRIDPEGALIVAGRCDDELKINGVRMHPNEIQQCLVTHPGVSAAAIVADKSRPEAPRLVAFWVADENEVPSDETVLRQHLVERLPAVMVPTTWRLMQALPITTNGKVDRQALQAAALAATAGSSTGRKSTTLTEQWVTRTCASLFEVTQADIDSNFFELGGTSLQAALLIGKAQADFGVTISFASVFSNPCLADIARLIEEAPKSADQRVDVAPTMETYPLSPQQRRWWNIYMPERNRSWATMVMLVELPFELEPIKFEQVLNELIDTQHSLRLRFEHVSGKVRQVLCADHTAKLTSFDDISGKMAEDQEAFVQNLKMEVANREIDPFVWPLFRTHLVRRSTLHHTLVFSIHHMISDGMSQNLTEQTLRARLIPSNTLDVDFPRLPFSYLDYALWADKEEKASSDHLAASEAYWDEVYRAPYSKLVFDELWYGDGSDRGRGWCVVVPADLGEATRVFCRRHGITVFSLFMAAKFLTLHQMTERADLVIGTPAAGRTLPGTELLIGNFISLVTIRSRVSEQRSNVEYSSDTMRGIALAMEHQNYQYDRLVQKLGLALEQDRFPLTTVFMSFLNFEAMRAKPLNAGDLGEKDLGYAVKFDMMTYLREHQDVFSIQVQYRNNLFDAVDIQNFTTLWLNQLGVMIAEPHQGVNLQPTATGVTFIGRGAMVLPETRAIEATQSFVLAEDAQAPAGKENV